MHFTCMKWGNKYSPDYVNNLYGMVRRNYSKRFKFVCYTDEPEGLDKHITVRSIPDVKPLHPKYWFGRENYCWDRAKFLVLNSHVWLKTKGPFCYLDLDIIIQNNIDDIDELAKSPHMIYSNWENPRVLQDRRFLDVRGSLYNSSVMLWCTDQGEKIYNDVLKHKDTVFQTFFKGTDNYYPYREHDVVGDNYWSFLPADWVYSYNRGQQYPEDLTEKLYREKSKFALFNVDVRGKNTTGVKPHELKNYNLLIHWHGKDEFENLWLPKFPSNFFTHNKHTEKVKALLRNSDYDTLQAKFQKDLPSLHNDWLQYSTKFATLKEWLGFSSLDDYDLEKNYMNSEVIADIEKLLSENDLASLADKFMGDFPELQSQLLGTVTTIKKDIPELEREISDIKFIKQIQKHHRPQIQEIYESGDMLSMHLKFCSDFPDDDYIQKGDQSLYWNKTSEEIYGIYKSRYIVKMHDVVADEAKEHGIVRYFWNISRLQCLALYRRLWNKNTLPAIKKDYMDNISKFGIQRIFWDSSEPEIQSLYKKYYMDYLKELFYKEDYEQVFERLYNIMPKEELLSILNQKDDDSNTLIKYFSMHGEQYSDLYRGLYEDGAPNGALIQLSTRQNDSGIEFNDIFVDGYEHTLKTIKNIFDSYNVSWVTFMCEITDPVNCIQFEAICKYFKEKKVTVHLQTFASDTYDYVDTIEVVAPKQQTETEEKIQTIIHKDIPVDFNTLKSFRHTDEIRTVKPKMKEKDPVWCDARKSGYFYVSSNSVASPCAFIARDVMENKFLPYHPIDYPFNMRYNSLANFTVGEVLDNSDFQNVSEQLKRRPLNVCVQNCGKCK